MTWELGYIFNPDYHNQGYCTEASSALIDFAFRELHAHKIVAFCNPAIFHPGKFWKNRHGA